MMRPSHPHNTHKHTLRVHPRERAILHTFHNRICRDNLTLVSKVVLLPHVISVWIKMDYGITRASWDPERKTKDGYVEGLENN